MQWQGTSHASPISSVSLSALCLLIHLHCSSQLHLSAKCCTQCLTSYMPFRVCVLLNQPSSVGQLVVIVANAMQAPSCALLAALPRQLPSLPQHVGGCMVCKRSQETCTEK